MQYTIEFKKAAIQKYLSRGNRTVGEILNEIGISSPTLYQWRSELANVGSMKNNSKPHSRPAKEKIKLLVEYDLLPVDKKGEFLRKNGLHEEHLKGWRTQIEEALSSKNAKADRTELVAEQKKIKQLEKELRRKEKALAEASALLILKKKADLIWGTEEED
jgi:transposase-like protein